MGGDIDGERTLTVHMADIGEAAFSVDASQRIVAWNTCAERLFGYQSDEVVGHFCHELLGGDERSIALCRSHCAMAARPARRPPAAIEVAVHTRTGYPRRVVMSTVVAHTPSGNPRIVHILRAPTGDGPLPIAPRTPGERSHRDDFGATLMETRGGATDPEPHFTPREREALRLLARGLSTAEIAEFLGVSRITARNHISKVMDKLDVRTRLQAVVVASRRGLL